MAVDQADDTGDRGSADATDKATLALTDTVVAVIAITIGTVLTSVGFGMAVNWWCAMIVPGVVLLAMGILIGISSDGEPR